MSKYRRYGLIALVVAVVLALIGIGVVHSANAAPNKLVCTGKVIGGAYHSVTVPEGESCTLIRVTVRHNVKALHSPHDVKVLNSVVGGNVHVNGATGLTHVGQRFCKHDPPVRGNVLVYNSHEVLICYVDGHNIQVRRSDGRITLRDNTAHRISVSNNPECVDCGTAHRRSEAIRLLRNVAERHIHAFNNDREIIHRRNTPDPVIR